MTALLSSLASSTPLLAYYGGHAYGYGGGLAYWIIFIGTLAISGIAALLLRSAYSKYSQMPATSGLTGAALAQRILESNGIHDVGVYPVPGNLTDHYDPSNKRLMLSEANYHGTSVAALGVSAHECGHAIQHQHAYAPLQWRMAAVGITNFASRMLYIIPFIGLIGYFLHAQMPYQTILTAFVLIYGVIMLFQLVTLPVEFDATRRAKKIVGEMGVIGGPAETSAMNRVLDMAALTYVAAFISALATFLYYFWRMQNSRN